MKKMYMTLASLKYPLTQKVFRKKHLSVDIFSNVFLKQSIKLLSIKFTVHNASW